MTTTSGDGQIEAKGLGVEPGLSPQGETREHTFSRRALLQAGWVVPAVLVLGLSTATVAGATALPHQDTDYHADQNHTDGTYHTDTPGMHNDYEDPFTYQHGDTLGAHTDTNNHWDEATHTDSTNHGDS